MTSVLIAGLPPDLPSSLGQVLGDATLKAVSTGEQAMIELERDKWSLFIIDHSLTGIAASRILDMVREELGLKKMPILYCAERDVGNDIAADISKRIGFGQILFYPIDSAKVIRWLGQPLKGSDEPVSHKGFTALDAQWPESALSPHHHDKDTSVAEDLESNLTSVPITTTAVDGDELQPTSHVSQDSEAHQLAPRLRPSDNFGEIPEIRPIRISKDTEEVASSHPQPDESRTQVDTKAAIAQLWERFRDTSMERVAALEEAVLDLLDGKLAHESRRKAASGAHKLAGSLGTFGFPEGTRLAREIEHILSSDEPTTQDGPKRLSELVLSLAQELERRPDDQKGLIDDEVPLIDNRTLLLIVSHDRTFAEQMNGEANARGMRLEKAINVFAAKDAVSFERPDVVILDLSVPEGQEQALALVSGLNAAKPPIPVVVLGPDDTLAERADVARLGGKGYLRRTTPPSLVIEFVIRLTESIRGTEATIMAVDDDRQVLSILEALLEPQGLKVVPLETPELFWDTLESCEPDLLIIDVEMPALNGVDLCKILRNDPRWGTLPVIFLTSHTEDAVVNEIFAAGADDYVTKPIAGPELVTRIQNRLERSRPGTRNTDSLTGQDHRLKAEEQINQLLGLAGQNSQQACLALLEPDNFDRVNQEYGFATGDSALRSIGEQLLNIFNSEELVARWAGEAFVIGMRDVTADEGFLRVSEAINTLSQQGFSSGASERFSMTFSAGVVDFPAHGTEMAALIQAAARALSEAKSAGGDRARRAEGNADDEKSTNSVDVAIVDDDEVLAELVVHLLETKGYSTKWFEDGEAAIEVLGGPNPKIRAGVILLDVDMPGLNGLDVLRHLVADGVLDRSKVIMLTARSVEAETVMALDLGASDHVSKPFSPAVLMQRIKRVLK